jgi:hypothetical protein
LLSQIRSTSEVGAVNTAVTQTVEPDHKHITPDIHSAKLKSLLAELKK